MQPSPFYELAQFGKNMNSSHLLTSASANNPVSMNFRAGGLTKQNLYPAALQQAAQPRGIQPVTANPSQLAFARAQAQSL